MKILKSILQVQLGLLTLGLLLVGCNTKKTKKVEEESSSTVKYAKYFTIEQKEGYSVLKIINPYQKEIIKEFRIGLKNDSLLAPATSVVVTSTTHIPMLELLEVEDKLVGFPNTNYISSAKTRQLIDNEKVQELGNANAMNLELLLDLKPDFIIVSNEMPYSKLSKIHKELESTIISNYEWKETTPLGRAEWIKFFGVLFGKEKEANAIFNDLEKRYNEIKNKVKEVSEPPSVLSGGVYENVWYLPAGESFEASFLKDAQVNYVWQETPGTGSLSLSFETVFEKGRNVDFWISPGNFSTLKQLDEAHKFYNKFKAFKEKKIYSIAAKKGATGGVLYYELGASRPDIVLKDLIKIFHPTQFKNHEFVFFEKLK